MTFRPPHRLILASASPRRSRLLADLGVRFEVRPPEVDETPLADETPHAMVERLARDKALARIDPGEVVIAADTTVTIDGEILGKPVDAADARRMLARIAGREHEVFTGVAVGLRGEAGPPRIVTRVDRTAVRMRALSPAEIAAYVATGEPLDKAGAYAIQERGTLLVAAIDGNFTNVVGLPLPTLVDCLAEFGLPILDFR